MHARSLIMLTCKSFVSEAESYEGSMILKDSINEIDANTDI